jgi:glycosyltransferase involved in cell wall biosynthesis
MRIALLAPLWKKVPPTKYGGTELVVANLADGLVRLGQDVTVFACGGSKSKATIVEVIDRPLYDMMGGFRFDSVSYCDLASLKIAFDAARDGRFDIINNHMNMSLAPFGTYCPVPMVSTNHSSVAPDNKQLSELSGQSMYISISEAQRKLAPQLNYVATIYHGIQTDRFDYDTSPHGGYLLFLATMSREKGADLAIEIAHRANMRLIMAGNVTDRAFFESLKPQIDKDHVIFVGEVGHAEKNKLMREAYAYLLPMRWQEAFGLTMVESLASGTPVIAFNKGAVPELIDNGKTGYIVSSVEQAVEAVKKIPEISRAECRHQAVTRFDVMRMAKDYLKLYHQLIACK